MVACLVPTMAIAVLTTTAADSKLQKLVWIGGFTILFAMGLTTFASEISRVQVFMAAAAYVLLLFTLFFVTSFVFWTPKYHRWLTGYRVPLC